MELVLVITAVCEAWHQVRPLLVAILGGAS